MSFDLEKSALPERRYVLCLSGGGLRAAFFHLGVIKSLRRVQLLKRIDSVYSVSGGSIIAAHMALNWRKYNGTEKEFEAAEQEIRQFGKRDVRGRSVRRWLSSWILFLPLPILALFPKMTNRSRLLEAQYEFLFKNEKLSKLSDESSPKIHLLTTSFTRGALCAFSTEGFIVNLNEPDGPNQEKLFRAGGIPIAKAVAASSAFPALFPPVKLTRKMINATVEEFSHSVEYLSDGGVFDNLGIDAAISKKSDGPNSDVVVIVSDAGSPFDWQVMKSFLWITSSSMRASDILMKRVGDLVLEATSQLSDRCKTLLISISGNDQDPVPSMSSDVVSRIPNIRTDLDTFNEVEQDCLIELGSQRSNQVLSADGFENIGSADANTYNTDFEKLDAADLENSSNRKLGLIDFFDWPTWVSLSWIILIAVVAPLSYSQFVSQELREKERQIENLLPSQGDQLALARTLWSEVSATSDPRGSEAIASVIMNRVRSRGFPDTVTGVVLQPKQFSCWSLEDTCRQRMLDMRPGKSSEFDIAYEIAGRAIKGRLDNPVGSATHYHARFFTPRWAKSAQAKLVLETKDLLFYEFERNE